MFKMNLPQPRLVLELFERLSENSDVWRSMRPKGPAFSRRRIYTLGVVVRLMMLQWLVPGGTLSQALQQWLQSRPPSERNQPISPRAGAYCRARQKLPILVAINVFEWIVERLRGWLPRNPLLSSRPVFVLDGSTLSLPHAPELVKAYPPSRNQYGESHWPIIRLVVLQDVQTGLALRPYWGPHHGPHAVGEQALALQAIPELPEQAVVIGDRNFGVFAIAWAAAQHRRDVLVRLTRQRAEALAGEPLTAPPSANSVGNPRAWIAVADLSLKTRRFPVGWCVSRPSSRKSTNCSIFSPRWICRPKRWAYSTDNVGMWKRICAPSSKPYVCSSSLPAPPRCSKRICCWLWLLTT
jgi:hypothetical protein